MHTHPYLLPVCNVPSSPTITTKLQITGREMSILSLFLYSNVRGSPDCGSDTVAQDDPTLHQVPSSLAGLAIRCAKHVVPKQRVNDGEEGPGHTSLLADKTQCGGSIALYCVSFIIWGCTMIHRQDWKVCKGIRKVARVCQQSVSFTKVPQGA